jgi:omega-amidase
MSSNLTITVIQSNLHWEDSKKNLQMFEEKINSISSKTELVVLPEMFTTGFSMQPNKLAQTMQGETILWMQKMASSKKIILTGSVMIEEDGNYFNRFIWMLPNGQFGYYNKRHLFAFAGEDEFYTAGNKRTITSVNGWKINLQVCYDLRFPVWSRQSFNKGQHEYDILLYVANWPQRRNTAWKTLLQARAIENQCFVIGVNRVGNDGNNIYHSGNSMIIDPLGEITYHKEDEEDIYTTTLSKQHLEDCRNKFPFWKDADNFFISNE